MAMMLAGQLGGQQPQQSGPQSAQVQPLGAAAQLAQKIMLMQALQKPPQQQPPQIPGQPPNPTTMGAPGLPGQALPQMMNAQPVPGGAASA
jgi:hypothetical protein